MVQATKLGETRTFATGAIRRKKTEMEHFRIGTRNKITII